jgi:uncharacterized membrane protein
MHARGRNLEGVSPVAATGIRLEAVVLHPLMTKFSIGLVVCTMAFGLIVGLIDPTATGSSRTASATTLSR